MEGSPNESPVDMSLAFSDGSHSLQQIYSLSCRAIEVNDLAEHTSLTISVTDAEVTPHLSFLVTTAPLSWVVRRSFQDFKAFRKSLAAAYPATYVPPAPPKRLKGNKSEKTGEKTQHFAQKFLEVVAAHPLLRRSHLFQSFLKDEDSVEWGKSHQSKSKQPEHLAEYTTFDGVAHCDPNRNVPQTTRMYEYLSSSFSLQRTIKRQAKKLEHQLVEVSESYKKLADTMTQLSRLQDILPYTGSLKNTLNVLESVVSDMSSTELDHALLIKETVRNYFKYSYNEAKPMLDLIKEEGHLYKTYSDAETKLNVKKEKLWVQGDVNKWELDPQQPIHDIDQLKQNREVALARMLSAATQKVQNQRDLFAHFNYKLTEELRFVVDFTTARNSRHFGQMFGAQIDTLHKQLETWKACAAELGRYRGEV